MTFDFSNDGLIISRYDGSDFQEDNLTITGAGDITVQKNGADFTISVATSSGTIDATYLRLDGTNGPMTGFFDLAGDPTTDNQAATKSYVDDAVAGAVLDVQEDGSPVTNETGTLNFTHALDVASGTGVATISVDESEFTTVVFLTGNQTISGIKTFADNVVVQGDLQVDGTTTTLNTQELLVEDNIVTFNSNWTGSAEASGIDAGIEVNRGTDDYAQIIWDETNNYWTAGISGSLERILLAGDLSDINADIATVSGLTVTNASAISTNAGNISTNASNITAVSGWVDTNFVELAGDTMTGFLTLSADPTANLHAATKQYVDAQVSSAAIEIQESDVTVDAAVGIINFGDGFTVASGGGGKVSITLDSAEGQFMDLINNQTASGVKTFADGIVLGSLSEPASGTAAGTQGDIRWSDDYIYVATATNVWKRVAIASF